MNRPDFPLVWDNSMRSSLVACPQRCYYEYFENWKSQYPNIDLHAGKSYAEGLEVARRAYYVDGKDSETSIGLGLAALIRAYGSFECPPDSPKSLNRLGEAFIFYWDCYPFASDPAQPYVGKSGPMIEFSFALPLDETLLHPVTGEPIIFAGRADMVATYAGACTIYDDKTTKSLGATWGQKWDMRAQFTGYTWAAIEYGIPVTQILVRAISILKTKLDTAQAISIRTPWRIATWKAQITRDIRRAMVMWEEGYWDRNESDSCDHFSGCMYKQPCMHENSQAYLPVYFQKRKWDPITRSELILNPDGTPVPVLTSSDAQGPWQLVGNVNDFPLKRR